MELAGVYEGLPPIARLLGANVVANDSWQIGLYNAEFFLGCMARRRDTVKPSRLDESGCVDPSFFKFTLDSVPYVKSPA